MTAFGRMMIEQSRQLVEDKYCTKNGYKYNSKVSTHIRQGVVVRAGGSWFIRWGGE